MLKFNFQSLVSSQQSKCWLDVCCVLERHQKSSDVQSLSLIISQLHCSIITLQRLYSLYVHLLIFCRLHFIISGSVSVDVFMGVKNTFLDGAFH